MSCWNININFILRMGGKAGQEVFLDIFNIN